MDDFELQFNSSEVLKNHDTKTRNNEEIIFSIYSKLSFTKL